MWRSWGVAKNGHGHRRSRLVSLLPFILILRFASSFSATSNGAFVGAGGRAREGVRRPSRGGAGLPLPSLTPKRTAAPHFPSPRRARKERGDENIEDADAGKISDGEGGFDPRRIDPLEIRLDATVLAIYVLGRFLVYDLTTGVKETPGWELRDVIMIIQTFSSAILLAALWTLAGVFVTGIFRYDGDDESVWGSLTQNTLISVPIWISTEIFLGWPTAGVLWLENVGGGGSIAFLEDGELAQYLCTLVGTGALGVGCTMAVGRYVRRFIA